MSTFLSILRDHVVRRIYVLDRSAQLAYYFLLSLFPFLLLLVSLLPYLPFTSNDILSMIRPFTPNSTYEILSTHLETVIDHERGGVLSLSILVTIYVASLAFQSIIRIMDEAYQVKETRPFWKEIIMGFILMLGLLSGLVVSFSLPIFGQILYTYVFKLFGMGGFEFIWTLIRWMASSILILAVFVFLYIAVPNHKISFKEALPGAIFATFGWQLSSLTFGFYVQFSDYSLIYGNLGAIIIMITWIYWSALVLIIGGHINAAVHEHKANKQKT